LDACHEAVASDLPARRASALLLLLL